jgi:long-chain acyl-CoA synthetase
MIKGGDLTLLTSLADMFLIITDKFANKTAMMYKKENKYHSVSMAEVRERTFNLAAALLDLGIKKGDRVLILSENRLEWALTDYAILLTGAVTVPIYPTLLASQIEYIINDSEGKVLFLSDTFQLTKIKEIRKNLPQLEHIISMEKVEDKDLIFWDNFLEMGKNKLKKESDVVKNSIQNITLDDLASIIYTSGTTGLPKGVMLTHGNFLSNIENSLKSISVTHNDTLLSFLPLSHVFERMAGHFLAFYCGATIAYAESIETVSENLKEVQPTVMTSVPRFFEKVYTKVMDSLEEGSILKKKIFFWAIEVGKKANIYKQKGLPLTGLLKFKYNLANKLVYSKLRERVGGRIRFFISGGAPLSKEIAEFFNAAGLILLEGYGLTESSPVIAVNKLDKFKFGSVGLPIQDIEVKISEEGEILSRGPHIMKGYFKDEASTKEAIDEEGWLHTGDIGYIDKDGFIFITDRKKNIIVTSGGKNIAPQRIENLLVTSPYIEQVIVVGNNRKYCSAIIVPNMDKLTELAKEKKITFSDEDDLLKNRAVNNHIRQIIDRASIDLASYETIKQFRLKKDAFSIESGELTPSLKIKRNVVEKTYKTLIDEMYQEE